MYLGLQIIRSDPSSAHGYAPGELMLGRALVYPCEIDKDDVDFEGTTMTAPLLSSLTQIHNENFGVACEKIKTYQAKYKRKYDKKHKVKDFELKSGDRVQIKKLRTKKAKGGKTELKWCPRNSFYTIFRINKRRKTVQVKKKNGVILKKHFNFDNVRAFKGLSDM